jgi:mannosyl-3-phosphoglycerate phosphatase
VSRDGRVVVSDLDGCLLDAASYSWRSARPALDALRRAGIPLVLCSSKTRAEIEPLHAELGLEAPFVFENGGGIALPAPALAPALAARATDGVVRLGVPIAELVRALDAIAAETSTRLRGFSRLSTAEVGELTGLAPSQAELARRREHDEPFVLDAGEEPLVRAAAERRGLRVTRGGRFHHLTGDVDKGRALRLVLSALGPTRSIGLGDAANDVPLLQAVDLPILVPRQDGSLDPALASAFPTAERAPAPGPEGWNRAVLRAVGLPLATALAAERQ